jgi:hypothetical protein
MSRERTQSGGAVAERLGTLPSGGSSPRRIGVSAIDRAGRVWSTLPPEGGVPAAVPSFVAAHERVWLSLGKERRGKTLKLRAHFPNTLLAFFVFFRGCFGGPEPDQGCAPAAVLGVVERVGHHVRVPGQDGVHVAAELAGAFAVNDPHLENPPLPASGEVVRDEFLDVLWTKGMEIQHAINRHLNRLVHEALLPRRIRGATLSACPWSLPCPSRPSSARAGAAACLDGNPIAQLAWPPGTRYDDTRPVRIHEP